VILIGDGNINDLSVYIFTRHVKAENGQYGMGSEMHGRNGKHCLLKVPMGAILLDSSSKKFVKEVVKHGQKISILKGDRGGKGNVNFKSSIN
jgi:GTP-binding protein